jgi:microcin C transport system permease protein
MRNGAIMFRHILPNAMISTMTFMPFILTGAIGTLTALDFLGFGLPPARRRWANWWPRASPTCRRRGWASAPLPCWR